MEANNWKTAELHRLLSSHTSPHKDGEHIYAVGVIGNPAIPESAFRSMIASLFGRAKVIALVERETALDVIQLNDIEPPVEKEFLFIRSTVNPQTMRMKLNTYVWCVQPRVGLKPLEQINDDKGKAVVGHNVTIQAWHLKPLAKVGFEFRITFRFVGAIAALPVQQQNL